MKSWARAALVLLLLGGDALSAETTVGQAIARLEPVPHVVIDDVQAGLLERPAAVLLPAGAARGASLQAVATAAGVRFRVGDGGWLGQALPPQAAPLVTHLHPSALRWRGPQTVVRPLLEPWWVPGAGLDHDPEFGTWTAVLPTAGHERLVAILSLLDAPRPVMPPWVVDAAQPPPYVSLQGLATWAAVAEALELPIARAPAVREWPALPAVARIEELVPALQRAGVAAAWQHGALCLGDTTDRQDAAESTAIACLLVPPRTPVERVLPAWTEPGWGVVVRGAWMVAVASPAALHAWYATVLAADREDLP